MTAGRNMRFQVWRMIADADNDDEVGGAQITGSMVYDNIWGRMQGNMPSQLLLQQGLETKRTFIINVRPATLLILEADELQVKSPSTHLYYGTRFVVDGVTISNFHPGDKRGYLLLNCSHSEVAHAY